MLIPLDRDDVQVETSEELLSAAYDERLRSFVPQPDFVDMVATANNKIRQNRKYLWVSALAIALGAVMGFIALILEIQLAADPRLSCPGNCFWLFAISAFFVGTGFVLRPYVVRHALVARDEAFRDMVSSGNEKFPLTQWRFEVDRVPFISSQICGLYTIVGMMPAVIIRCQKRILDEHQRALQLTTDSSVTVSPASRGTQMDRVSISIDSVDVKSDDDDVSARLLPPD